MKPTKSILILLSLFLMFSCDDKNSIEPLVCDEGLTIVDGECIYICEEGVTECYYQSDLDVLQQFIDNSQEGENPPPSDLSPIELGEQVWEDGRLVEFCSSNTQGINCYMDYQLTTLPESFGDLSSLEYLSLSSNQLTTLPESFGDLSSLEYLSLYYNQLTTLPESFGNLSSLEWLNLGVNQLTTLPESIGNLSSLGQLILNNNQLTTLPESFGNLSSLEMLYLSYNQLTTLPESIGDLSSLWLLRLNSNSLTSLPESICNLPSNCDIDVGNNQLCEEYHYDCIDDWEPQDCDE